MAGRSSKEDVLTWTEEQVLRWADDMSLGDKIINFCRSQNIKGTNLLRLIKAELVSIAQLSFGDADDLIAAIDELKDGFSTCFL